MHLIAVTVAIAGCSKSPAAPSLVANAARGAAPSITSIVPAVSSSRGGAALNIIGTGFRPGMTATFDNSTVTGHFDTRDVSFTTFFAEVPAHPVGVVDVVVTNPDGQSHRLAGAYTYAPPESFDMNGAWSGFSTNGTDTSLEFTIQNNRLVSATCQYDTVMPFALAEFPTVIGGEFSLSLANGQSISARIVSASQMVGTFTYPTCTSATLPFSVARHVG